MSKELTYYVSDAYLDYMITHIDKDYVHFSALKNETYKNEIKIILPKKKVKKYIVLYEFNGNFLTTDFWDKKYFANLEEFNLWAEQGLKPIQLILESEKIFEE